MQMYLYENPPDYTMNFLFSVRYTVIDGMRPLLKIRGRGADEF